MVEDFWGPIFARLLVDYDFLELVVNDTADTDLVSWIKPNRAIFARCARFLKKNRVLDKPALAREMLAYARNDEPLRKIILFTWVEKNPLTMRFPTLVVDAAVEGQLQSGEFGGPAKIKILAAIDPRDGVKPLYERVLAAFATEAAVTGPEPVDVSTQPADQALIGKFGQRIVELEKILEEFKIENRQLKKLLEARQGEITAQNRRIEEYSRKIREAEQKEQELTGEVAGLRSRLIAVEKQLTQVRPVIEMVPSSDHSEQLSDLFEELAALRRAVENREATIRRLEGEKSELTAHQAADLEKDRQLVALRQHLAALDPAVQGSYRLAGQLLSSHKDSSGKRSWLFLSLSGRVVFVEGSLVSKTSLVREEFCQLYLDANDRPVALESLEADARREICGCLDDSGDDVSLIADDQRFKVQVEIGGNLVGVPVRCVWLPGFADRPAGVYRVEALAQHDQAVNIKKTAGLRQIMNFFKADQLDYARFLELLRQQGVDFSTLPDRVLSFSADYHEVLQPLRMRTRVYRSCSSAVCQERARAELMAGSVSAGQVCDFCGRRSADSDSTDKPRFAGQRVLVFGGDYIGSEYERALAGYNLNVEWHSGFKNLAELKQGLGHPDLVLIIVRQISHTLLRELVTIIERDSLPVLYSSRRGISGILAELTGYFRLPGRS